MTLIITKGKKTDYDNRVLADRSTRKQVDIHSGLTKTTAPQRGDYKLCRDLDKTLSDYRRYKNTNDRKKIENEYFGKQAEYRKNLRRD